MTVSTERVPHTDVELAAVRFGSKTQRSTALGHDPSVRGLACKGGIQLSVFRGFLGIGSASGFGSGGAGGKLGSWRTPSATCWTASGWHRDPAALVVAAVNAIYVVRGSDAARLQLRYGLAKSVLAFPIGEASAPSGQTATTVSIINTLGVVLGGLMTIV